MSHSDIPSVHSIDISQSIVLLLSSIAVEEMALAHIVNGEAEKIQYVAGALDPLSLPHDDISVDDLLAINDSVRNIMEDMLLREIMLHMKFNHMMSALEKNSTHCPHKK